MNETGVGLRARIHAGLDPAHWPNEGISPHNRAILAVVMVSIFTAVLESESTIYDLAPGAFVAANAVFAILFSIEYAARLWCMGELATYAGIRGRLRYAMTATSLVDLVATLSLWFSLFYGAHGVYGVLLRLVRVLRVITLARRSRWASCSPAYRRSRR